MTLDDQLALFPRISATDRAAMLGYTTPSAIRQLRRVGRKIPPHRMERAALILEELAAAMRASAREQKKPRSLYPLRDDSYAVMGRLLLQDNIAEFNRRP